MNVVLSCLFTTMADPLAPLDPGRQEHWPSDPHIADTLLDSLPGVNVVVFHDGLDTEDPRFHGIHPPEAPNAYLQRWITYRRWLIANPEVRFCWAVDVGDVECLAPERLWDIKPGVLYCGYEPEVVGCGWMADNHEASAEWIKENADKTLLNMGVVGGDRGTVLMFSYLLLNLWKEGLAEGKQDRLGDMGYGNRAAYSMKHETGPHIVTEFWKNERNTWSLFRHK